jgi:signal transduction histidine kinase
VNVELEAADVAKNVFLANMSHELRTPLNAILGFTGTMLMELPGPLTDEQAKQLRTVQANGRHLLSIINDLLDLGRIESGNVELNVEPIPCRGLAEEVVLGLQPLAEQKGIEMAWVAPEDDLEVRTDRRSLSQILINLTNNAIKFTDEGSVRLEVSRESDNGASAIRFSVIDTGRGIDPNDQQKLFAAFQQVQAYSADRDEGTGLGLYICQRLTALIGGVISFESEFGKGSIFTLELRG